MASWKTEPGLRTSPLSRMSLPLCRMKIEDKMRIANSASMSSESLWDVPEPPTIDSPPTGEGATGAAGTAGTGAMGESPNGEPPAGGPAPPPSRALSTRSTVRATPPATSAVHPTRSLASSLGGIPNSSSNEDVSLLASLLTPLWVALAVAEGTWSFPESGIDGGAGSALGLAISSGACVAVTGCSAGGADAAGSNNGGVAAVVPDSGAVPERIGVGADSAGAAATGSGSSGLEPGNCSFMGTGSGTGSTVGSDTGPSMGARAGSPTGWGTGAGVS